MSTRILLVEDDPLIIEALTELLVESGYHVDTADTQQRAIELAAPATGLHPYRLVLLDVTLRQGNGFAVCAAIKENTPDVPVIFLTASDDEFNTVAGLQMGADDYVAKPFRPRELLARIAAIMRRSQPSRRIVGLGPYASTPIARMSNGQARSLRSRHSNIACCCSSPPILASS